MRKAELLPTQDCEAGYGPGPREGSYLWSGINKSLTIPTYSVVIKVYEQTDMG